MRPLAIELEVAPSEARARLDQGAARPNGALDAYGHLLDGELGPPLELGRAM